MPTVPISSPSFFNEVAAWARSQTAPDGAGHVVDDPQPPRAQAAPSVVSPDEREARLDWNNELIDWELDRLALEMIQAQGEMSRVSILSSILSDCIGPPRWLPWGADGQQAQASPRVTRHALAGADRQRDAGLHGRPGSAGATSGQVGTRRAEVEPAGRSRRFGASAASPETHARVIVQDGSGQALAHTLQAGQPLLAMDAAQRAALSHGGNGEPLARADDFFRWLGRVVETQDARNPLTREPLARRLGELVTAMQADVWLRERCFDIAEEAITTCGDRVALALNQMHEAMMNAKALRPGVDEKTLVGLGIEAFVLMLIKAQASLKIQQLQQEARADGTEWQEDVETMLFYQVGLPPLLASLGVEAPLPAQDMLFEQFSGVGLADLQQAARHIAAVYKDGRSLCRFLVEDWSPMRERVRREFAQQFAGVTARYQDEMNAIDDMDLDGAAYQEKVAQITQAERAARARLHSDLATDLVRRHLPATFVGAQISVAPKPDKAH